MSDYTVVHRGFSVGPFSSYENARWYLAVNARVPGKIVSLDDWRANA